MQITVAAATPNMKNKEDKLLRWLLVKIGSSESNRVTNRSEHI